MPPTAALELRGLDGASVVVVGVFSVEVEVSCVKEGALVKVRNSLVVMVAALGNCGVLSRVGEALGAVVVGASV